jgi:hypothetical protein
VINRITVIRRRVLNDRITHFTLVILFYSSLALHYLRCIMTAISVQRRRERCVTVEYCNIRRPWWRQNKCDDDEFLSQTLNIHFFNFCCIRNDESTRNYMTQVWCYHNVFYEIFFSHNLFWGFILESSATIFSCTQSSKRIDSSTSSKRNVQ